MLISLKKNHLVVQVDQSFHDLLQDNKIYQAIYKGKEPYRKRFKNESEVKVFRNAQLEQYVTIMGGNEFYQIGRFSSVRAALPMNSIVGRYCSIGADIEFLGGRHPIEAVSISTVFYHHWREHFHAYLNDHIDMFKNGAALPAVPAPQPQSAPLKIGHDVWIGSKVVLKGGIKIGTGAVIAANSVVTKDVPPYAIVGGNPAKLIRYRFSDDICQGLLRSEWWDYELSDLINLGMDFANPESFLQQFLIHQSELRKPVIKSINLYDEVLRLANQQKVSSLQSILAKQGVIETFHQSYLAIDLHKKAFVHKKIEEIHGSQHLKAMFFHPGEQGQFLAFEHNNRYVVNILEGELHPVESHLIGENAIQMQRDESGYYAKQGAFYLCADKNGIAAFNRKHRDTWETFKVIQNDPSLRDHI